MTAKVSCSTIMAELPNGEKALFLDIQIDCPVCGRIQVRLVSGNKDEEPLFLPGHHLRMIRNALVDAIDQYPTLTGTDAQIQQVDRFGWSGPPQKSEMN